MNALSDRWNRREQKLQKELELEVRDREQLVTELERTETEMGELHSINKRVKNERDEFKAEIQDLQRRLEERNQMIVMIENEVRQVDWIFEINVNLIACRLKKSRKCWKNGTRSC